MRPNWLSVAGSFLALVLLCGSAIGCSPPGGQTADLVLHGGKVVTVDTGTPDGEAIAVLDGKILAVGTDAEIEAYIAGSSQVIDLEGQLAIPGFTDSHVHFSGIGTAQLQLKLMDVANWDEVVGMVAAAVADAETGELILGRGWHQEKWDRTGHSEQKDTQGCLRSSVHVPVES